MIHKLSLKLLAGIDKLPSFYSYVKENREKLNLAEGVELSKAEWADIKDEFKGVYNGIPHFIDLHESVLKMVPVTGSWLHKQEAFEDKTGAAPKVEGDKFEEKKSADTKEPSFNNFEKMDATGKAATKEACPASPAVKDGEKSKEQAQSEKEHSDPKSTTYDQASENNKDEKPKDAPPDSEAVKESAEEAAKSIIASVYNKNRKTKADPGNTNADAGKHEDELDSYKGDIKKTVDQAEYHADKPTNETETFHDSPDKNPKVAGDKFADKKGASTKKPSFDNFKKMEKKDAIHGNALEEALKFLETFKPDLVKAVKDEQVASKEATKNPFGKKKSQKSK